MTDENSIRLPSPSEVSREAVKRIARRGNRYNIGGRFLIAVGLGAVAVLLVVSAARSDVPEQLRDLTLSLGMGMAALGLLALGVSVALHSDLIHYQASRFDADLRRVQLVADCERFVQGIDTGAIGRLTAQLQAVEVANSLLVTAIERMTELEHQLNTLMGMVKESSGSATDDLMAVARRAYADGLKDMMWSYREESAERKTSKAAQSNGNHDVIDTKYLVDMSEAIRLGRELERRELMPPPDSVN